MRMFKSKCELPQHKIGDILIESESSYKWVNIPIFEFNKEMIEDNPEWFEEINLHWEKGETFFFISSNFDIIESEFNPTQHYNLVLAKNIFKTKNEALWLQQIITELLNNDDIVLTNTNKIKEIISNIKSNNNKTAITCLLGLI